MGNNVVKVILADLFSGNWGGAVISIADAGGEALTRKLRDVSV